MRNGPDTENLFHQLNIEAFPYREFSDGRPPTTGSSTGNSKWSTSLEILQREWIQATQTHAMASVTVTNAAEQAPNGASAKDELYPTQAPAANTTPPLSSSSQSRARLKNLFRREVPETAPARESSLSDLFDRIR